VAGLQLGQLGEAGASLTGSPMTGTESGMARRCARRVRAPGGTPMAEFGLTRNADEVVVAITAAASAAPKESGCSIGARRCRAPSLRWKLVDESAVSLTGSDGHAGRTR